MAKYHHARVRELFLRARQLKPENRSEFLHRECADDTTVAEEVTSLLEFDSSATILAGGDRLTVSGSSPLAIPRPGYIGRLEAAVTQLLHRWLGRPSLRLTFAAICLSLLGVLAAWTYFGMKRTAESSAASELRTILNADVKALELWIEEKKKDVLLWSSRPEIRQAVISLVEVADGERDPGSALLASAALRDLRRESEEYDRVVGRPEQDVVLDRSGLVLGSNFDEAIGRQLNVNGISALVPVFQGETRFIKPQPYGTFGIEATDVNLPVVSVIAPIRKENTSDGEIVAAAAFGFPADGEFSQILSVARKGQTGETYTFDDQGLLLSESRFDDQLRNSGMLPDDHRARSIFRIEIRDPGKTPVNPPRTAVEAAERPLTRLAAAAIASSRRGSEGELEGVIVEPYRNYRGVPVIGAWKWLPTYSFAVATEVEVSEQYAPMQYPIAAEWIRFGLLAACFTSLLGAACWIVVLGRDLEQARQLGQYTLEEKIGEGGMSVVYRARHSLLRRRTAIKLLRPGTVTERALARFEREVQLASSLTHPNTIRIFDFGHSPSGSFYCVMELLDGRPLDELVRAEGPLAASRVIRMLRQVASSLGEAHRRGLVHRDIKPSNIMLCEQGGIRDFVKVLDFGLARSADAREITQYGVVVGTPSFMAPERISDPTFVDPRSDIYSLGAVAYYLLTGQNVHQAPNLELLIHQLLSDDPRRPSEFASEQMPAKLEELVVRCLSRDASERPANVEELLETLGSLQVGAAPDDIGV